MKTVSLDLSKKLKEAGYPQDDSYFRWVGIMWNTNEFKNTQPIYELWDEDHRTETREGCYIEDQVSAPTADEILDRLPIEVQVKDSAVKTGVLRIHKRNNNKYEVVYRTPSGTSMWSGNFEWRGDLLADAVAKMWLYLKNNKLLPKEKKG